MKLAITLAVALAMAGCASGVPVEEPQEAMESVIPTCATEAECELLWRAAREWLVWNTQMKLQHMTPDLMQTYNPPLNSGRFAARVVKEPVPEGGYRIVAGIWCNNFLGCFPSEWDAVQSFNNYLNAVSPPAPSSTQASVTCSAGRRQDGDWCIRNNVAPVWCPVPPNAWKGDECVQPDGLRLEPPPRP